MPGPSPTDPKGKNLLKRFLGAALLSQALVGFAWAAAPVPVAICDSDRRAMGEPCQEYIGSNYRQAKMQQQMKHACDNAKSKWSLHTACPAAGRVGVCRLNGGTPSEIRDVFYAQERDAASACTTMLQGKWSAQ